jgi:hypothetical protein
VIFLGGLKGTRLSELQYAIKSFDESILTENRLKMILSFLPLEEDVSMAIKIEFIS